MSKPFIYMDNAATTKVAPQVLDAMLPYFSEIYANGSSVYQFGQTAKEAIENARAQAATLIGARPRRYISQAAAVNRITGLSRMPQKCMATRESTLSQATLSSTQYCTPASILRSMASR